jgi:hypothetical protein
MKKSTLFKLKEEKDIEDTKTSICKKEIIPTNFWDLILSSLPTPEEEIETMEKDESVISENIKELQEILSKIQEALSSDDISEEDKEVLKGRYVQYETLLDTYSSDLTCTSIQKKALTTLLKDDELEDEKLEKEFPSMLATSIFSTKKKMEDVNSIVDIIETKEKKNKVEICVECNATVKDDKGRKSSIQHYHFPKDLSTKKYKPVVCFKCIKTSENINLEYEFKPDKSDEINEICQKGSTVYSCTLSEEIPYLKEKIGDFIKNKMKEELNEDIFPPKKIFSLF